MTVKDDEQYAKEIADAFARRWMSGVNANDERTLAWLLRLTLLDVMQSDRQRTANAICEQLCVLVHKAVR